MTSMATRTYRADIDGLRGVAIVLVLLFHGTKICPGGFIGVDVFFTISGFFYLLPSRAWEMLLGGLLCFAPIPQRRPALFANLLAGIGLLGILLSACTFDKETPFPGRAALLPCIGTAMLIYANSWTKTWVGRVLATRPVVFVGLISYSLYLWHWPLLSFLAYLRCGGPADEISRGIALAVSFVLAVVSWRFVELPLRRKNVLPGTKGLLIAAAVAVSILLTSSLAIVRLRGLPQRISQQADAYARTEERDRGTAAWQLLFKKVPIEQVIDGTLPTFGATSGDATCLVWGDSHAMAVIPGIDAACTTRGVRGFQAPYSATPPLLDFHVMTPYGLSERAIAFNRATVDFAVAKRVDIIFISGRWKFYARRPTFAACLGRTIEELSDAGIHVVLVRDVADFYRGANPTRKLAMAVQLGRDVTRVGMPLADHLRANERCNTLFDRIARNNVSVFDPAPAFVDETGLWRAEYGGESMYIDDDHLSIAGSLRLQPLFEALFDRLLPPAEQSEDAP